MSTNRPPARSAERRRATVGRTGRGRRALVATSRATLGMSAGQRCGGGSTTATRGAGRSGQRGSPAGERSVGGACGPSRRHPLGASRSVESTPNRTWPSWHARSEPRADGECPHAAVHAERPGPARRGVRCMPCLSPGMASTVRNLGAIVLVASAAASAGCAEAPPPPDSGVYRALAGAGLATVGTPGPPDIPFGSALVEYSSESPISTRTGRRGAHSRRGSAAGHRPRAHACGGRRAQAARRGAADARRGSLLDPVHGSHLDRPRARRDRAAPPGADRLRRHPGRSPPMRAHSRGPSAPSTCSATVRITRG